MHVADILCTEPDGGTNSVSGKLVGRARGPAKGSFCLLHIGIYLTSVLRLKSIIQYREQNPPPISQRKSQIDNNKTKVKYAHLTKMTG